MGNSWRNFLRTVHRKYVVEKKLLYTQNKPLGFVNKLNEKNIATFRYLCLKLDEKWLKIFFLRWRKKRNRFSNNCVNICYSL